MNSPAPSVAAPSERPSALAVLLVFLRLGLTSFGGPVAHLGYFRAEFVQRRRWLDDRGFTDLVALCQFLPGPSSSQVGIAIGMLRAGWLGSLAAWLGFTLPSALLMTGVAYGLAGHAQLAQSGVVHGLKLAAVAVVAQAVWGMARSLCPDRPRAGLAIGAALLTLALPGWIGQVAAIALSAAAGLGWLRPEGEPAAAHQAFGVSRRAGAVLLSIFGLLLAGLPLLAAALRSPVLHLVDGVFRAGSLVFGGGHVVLPLLEAVVVPSGAVSNADFLAGYGAAQALPGPLFAFAAFLGASMHAALTGWLGAVVFLLAIFVPAWLLVLGALPFWDSLRQRARVRSAMAGVNAGVVGVLLSALYDPVWTSAVHTRGDFALALAAFGLPVTARVSPFIVVALVAAAGALLATG
ncbi:chromate efflux transporter [Scleromatobacter humisilvae]|uniref:Chromate efflux transporter n=1 Tax=Scleromatobacter humisilvae TaxID=2897159 RepID=A0A9X1YM34_9BURK|nr:chromate efflux transporter [Scleromatobacter humisilvae]MCK9688859.1 chromate efflux transporter [Scleromatobacter humisilvae]